MATETGTAKGRSWVRALRTLDACGEAVQWAEGYPSLRVAWAACPRGDWMLWYLGRRVPDTPAHRETLTCVAIEIMRSIKGRQAIPAWDTWAERYLRGEDRSPARAAEAAESARAAAWAAETARAAAAAAETAAETAAAHSVLSTACTIWITAATESVR